MRVRTLAQQWAIGIATVLLVCTLTSAITVTQKIKNGSRSKSVESVSQNDGEQNSQDKLLRRSLGDDDEELLESTLPTKQLIKRAQNISDSKSDKVKPKSKEDSPTSVDVINGAELREDDGFAKADKNPRIYYGESSSSGFPHGNREEPEYENGIPDKFELNEKAKGKLYYPKHFMSSKFGQGHKKSQSSIALSGKRAPDHVEFDNEDHHHEHDYASGHGHVTPQHHHTEEHDHSSHGHGEPSYEHGIEEHHGKGHHHGHHDHHDHYPDHHHVSGYGYNHHYGSYRHTIGDKVEAVGKALKVLIPSALLLTGVSALFPNRVHVPTTPNLSANFPSNYIRQKRSTTFYRRRSPHRGPPSPPTPVAEIQPQLEDIPSHILRAEHRIMEGNPADMYPEPQREQSVSYPSAEASGFNPFSVFKGPGFSTAVQTMQNSMPMPSFPDIPEMSAMHEQGNQFMQQYGGLSPEVSGEDGPQPGYERDPSGKRPGTTTRVRTTNRRPSQQEVQHAHIGLDGQPTDYDGDSFGSKVVRNPDKPRRHPQRRRKPGTGKPSHYHKESNNKRVQDSSESQHSQYSQNEDLKHHKSHNAKAEQQFMSSLTNLVTPDVAKAIIENKNEPPKEVDLSPDGPVMGLLNSYAQHDHDTPSCQKRALCELAVRGKSHKSSKFEAFLWSVATLVPDVFSEMYDLQEVFQGIRDERCTRFACANPNMDLQL